VRFSRGGFAAAVWGELRFDGRTWGGGALIVRVGTRLLTILVESGERGIVMVGCVDWFGDGEISDGDLSRRPKALFI
jgi:hypothetical protein